MDSLEQRLHLDDVDHRELILVLSQCFRGTGGKGLSFRKNSREPKRSRYVFSNESNQTKLVIEYDDENRRIQSIEGQQLSDSELESLASQVFFSLLENQTTKIGRVIGYSDVPLLSTFRYRNLFQILPLPEEAPRPESWRLGNNPFLLEFTYRYSAHRLIQGLRMLEIHFPIIRLMNLFCNVSVHIGPMTHRHAWTRLLEAQSSELKLLGYTYPGFNDSPDLKDFTSIQQTKTAPLVDDSGYYNNLTFQELALPENIIDLFDAAYSLEPKDSEQFSRACALFYQARDIFWDSNTAGYVLLTMAIETLIDTPDLNTCTHCGQPQHRITKRFRDFVEQYAPFINELPKEKELFYTLRSSLAHGTKVLIADIEPWRRHLDSANFYEHVMGRVMFQVTGTALRTWLLSRSKTTI